MLEIVGLVALAVAFGVICFVLYVFYLVFQDRKTKS